QRWHRAKTPQGRIRYRGPLSNHQSAPPFNCLKSLEKRCDRPAPDALSEGIHPDESVVFGTLSRTANENNRTVPLEIIGEKPSLQRQRMVTHPLRFSSEPFFYEEEAWESGHADGTATAGFRITRSPRENHQHEDRAAPPDTTPTLAPSLAHILEESQPNDRIEITAVCHGATERKLPALPFLEPPGSDNYESAKSERLVASEARLQKTNNWLATISKQIEKIEGAIIGASGSTRVVHLTIPARNITAALRLPRVASLHPYAKPELAAAISLGDAGSSDYTNAEDFQNSNNMGDRTNPGMHNESRLVLAVLEPSGLPPGPCFTMRSENAASCGPAVSQQRLHRYQCSNTACTRLSSSESFNNWGYHSVPVSSIAFGDYTNNQGTGHEVGDSNWTSGNHSPAWEQAASTIAREAQAVHVAVSDTNGNWQFSKGIEAMLDDYPPDVMTISANSGGECYPISNNNGTAELIEEAFDEGTFVVVAAGNHSSSQDENDCNVGGWPTLRKHGLQTASTSTPAGHTKPPQLKQERRQTAAKS
ncbi:MAG: S8/S53 family peptidase, partial [Dehalococcoidales bacterium]